MSEKLSKTHLETWRLFIMTHAKLIGAIDYQLTTAQKIPLHWYDVLIELYEAPDRRLRMHELADRVVLSRSGLTRLVDNLEKAGYLRREINLKDRRGFFAVITEEGIAALREAWPIYAEGIAQFFAQHLDEESAVLLARLFSKMLAGAK